jgi:hypothetical protein
LVGEIEDLRYQVARLETTCGELLEQLEAARRWFRVLLACNYVALAGTVWWWCS